MNKTDSAVVLSLRNEISIAVLVVDVYVRMLTTKIPVLTAGADGKHMKGSRHYKQSAIDVDWEPWGKPPENIEEVASAVRTALGRDYDVVEHETHLHVEWDPK
jgi:hypothetical protein